jgi:class 3 adenylate cyclase
LTEERRLVTVLFADVVGSTALGEALDPEDVRALLARFFAIARDAIEQHGGQLEKFIGDAVMAVFGLPVAHDDDPARALAAAIELRDRVRLDPSLGERLPIRLGVNGGEVIATRGSRDGADSDFLITGDAVNSAARLQQGAEAWGILVGERTARAVGDRFVFGSALAIERASWSPPRRLAPFGATEPASWGGRRTCCSSSSSRGGRSRSDGRTLSTSLRRRASASRGCSRNSSTTWRTAARSRSRWPSACRTDSG